MQIWGGDGGLDVVANPLSTWSRTRNRPGACRGTTGSGTTRNAAGAIEPPDSVKKQKELYDQLFQTATTEGQDELMKQILDIGKEDFYVMGVSLAPKGYAVVKNNVHNVPQEQPAAYSYPTPGPMQMAQIWKSE